MPTEAEIDAAFEVLHAGKTSPYVGPVQVTLTKEKVRAALEAAERARRWFVLEPTTIPTTSLTPWRDGIVESRLAIGGIIEMAADQVDFEKTYTFEASDHKGQVYRWSGIRPEPRPETGAAVFKLPDQKIR